MSCAFIRKRFSIFVLCLLLLWQGQAGGNAAPGDCVILLHGLWGTTFTMKRLEWKLKADGYRVINVPYASMRHSIPELASGFLDRLLRERISDSDARIHFVTHSLGGIVLRQYLAHHQLERLGRVVMLAPPNQGSPLAEKLRHVPGYKFLTGPSGQQLGIGSESIPLQLGPANFELGVIAGDRRPYSPFCLAFQGANDGKVAVADTRLEGMHDFLVVHRKHTWLAWRKEVMAATLLFLKSGRFQ